MGPERGPSLLPARLTRRRFLRSVGAASGALWLAPLLSACGADDGGDRGFHANPEGRVDFANWPLYVDKVETASGHFRRPSLDLFTEETGILVNYRQVIEEAGWFYERIEPYLAAGRPTGWDVMVITNGAPLTRLMALEYLEQLPADLRPNFDMNAGRLAKDPPTTPATATRCRGSPG